MLNRIFGVLADVNAYIWNEKYWLPEGVHWHDFKSTAEFRRPQHTDIYYAPILAVIMLILRYIFERYIALNYCKYLGIHNKNHITVEKNELCEQVFTQVTKFPDSKKIKELAEQSSWKEAKVASWFRKRRAVTHSPLLSKATESCWRFSIYLFLFLFGCYTVLTENWFYDTKRWMEGKLINQDFTTSMRIYYSAELAFYTSLLFSQFIDVKRKDFYQMFLHHIVTIILILHSVMSGFTRIGAVIMVLHDASDIWLEAAKVYNYAKMQKLCDGLFFLFAVVFYLTRWVYYPFWVIHCMIYYSWSELGPFFAYYQLVGFLFILQGLHFYWGILIGKMVYKFAVLGKVGKDDRSDDEESDDNSRINKKKL
ncbi:ceramide synthase 6 isoform X1 [Hydra vulgaris]|uniref:ceramide synthase 6 isoform X1 n=1 Tax=Hydra vulgaris TaxID=6087 RepID=UPI000640E3AA|nr:ceramide synthase 6 [Hydra vulgaris]XP_047136318.1 ceramide synthase 6 [Hydra vulgaris]XP_047136319.1 ceramide synthase 6 [Hydra vulgaris]